MELEEAHNNLRAMRLLYRLLEDSSLGLQNSNTENLVGRARDLLKNMMDVTAERVFETILQIIATEAGISKTPCTSQREKPVASLQLKPLSALSAANSSQGSVKYPTRSIFTSPKVEQPQLKSPAMNAVPGQSKSRICDKGETIRKTLCSVGEESSIMQQNLVKAANLFYEKPILPIKGNRHHDQQNSVNTFHVDEHSKETPEMFEAKVDEFREVNETLLRNRIREIQCNPNASGSVETQNEEGDISNDLVDAIKRIESCILALQLCSSVVYSKKNSAGDQSMHKVSNSDSPLVQKNEGIAGNQPSYVKSLLEGNGLTNQQANRLSDKGKNLTTANLFEEPISTRNESLSKVKNQIQRPETFTEPAKSNGITIQGSSKKGEVGRATRLASRGQKLLSRNGVQPPAQSMAMIERLRSLNRSASGNDYLVSQTSECIQGLRIPLNTMSAGPTTKDKPVRRNPAAQSETERRVKQPLHQMVFRPTLLDQRSSEVKIYPHLHRDCTVLENRGTRKMRASLPQHHESEEFSSSSSSSASWTSRQSSAIHSSESEDIVPSPGRMVGEGYEDSSGDSGDSYSHNDAGSSRRVESFISGRSCRRRDPEKTMGRLRRLKNKLGLVFHHHHHHHHHHHVDDDSKYTKVYPRHSMWNHLQKIFHGKNKHKVLRKRKVENTRGGAVARVPRGKQVGQFHGLVEGLLRHIRHSKKRKPSKVVEVKGSRIPPRGNRKKLHWWQMLRRHRGVNLNNRGRLKKGFKSQKSLKN